VAVAIAIAACVLIVHDLTYVLRAPYWLDEAWVAESTRLSLSHLPKVTEVSPIGWSFLLRLVPTGAQDQRLIPLVFAAATVLAAYAFGRSLRIVPIVTGIFAAGAALLAPAMLVRNDLKQYTADAFVAVLGLALVSRLEASWSRRRLVTLCAVFLVGALISHVTLLVAAAALPCLCVTRLARRRREEFIEAAVGTVATGLVLLAIYVLLDGGTRTHDLKHYWEPYFLPNGFHASLSYINTHLHALVPYFGVNNLYLLAGLVLLGLVVIALQGRWATAAILPILVAEVVVLSALQRYPLLDERTSTFLVVSSMVIAAVGVVGVAHWIAQRLNWVAAGALLGIVATLYIITALPFVRGQLIPHEDVRAQEAYVAAHERPGDVVIVSNGANYGYAYYGHAQPKVVTSPGIGYSLVYPPSDRIVTVVQPETQPIQAAVPAALTLAKQHPGARVWFVLNHEGTSEEAVWNTLMARLSPHTVEVAPDNDVSYVVPNASGTHSTSPHSAVVAPGSPTPTVTLRSSKLGKILVNSEGRTLYAFTKNGKPATCVCGHTWQPLLVPAGAFSLRGGPGVTSLGKSTSGNVVTFMGYPLSVYAGDTASGQVNGNGIHTDGGTWYAIKFGETVAPLVGTAKSSKYGTILVNDQGRTLYAFSQGGKPAACVCGRTWQPLLAPIGFLLPRGGPGVTDLGKSASGTVVTYMDYPLSVYSGDLAPGQANGNGIHTDGGVWYVIKVGEKPGTPVAG
jgi:predicted lipoprotein with Yx(FWY)xxD motif